MNKREIALKRKEIIEKARKLKTKGIRYADMEEILGVKGRILRYWKQMYKRLGIRGLEPQSTRPNRLAGKRVLTDKLLRIIEDIRKANPYYGKIKVKEILKRQGQDITLSTVGNGLSILMKEGRILPVYILSCTKERKRLRKYNNCHAKRLLFGHKTQIQLDHMVLNIKGMEIRQFCAYDRQYKLLVSQIYKQATSQNAKDFLLNHVLKEFPFKVNQIQVDGGSEFMAHFEQACKDNNIDLFVLPPRTPKLNGGVERVNRIFQEEYYLKHYNLLQPDLCSLRKFVKQSLNHYNYLRIHRHLSFNNRLFSPMEFFNLSKTAICL